MMTPSFILTGISQCVHTWSTHCAVGTAQATPQRSGLEVEMHFGAFFYGTVDMPDAGVDGPPAHQRHYGQEDYRRAYADLIAYAEPATRSGTTRCGRPSTTSTTTASRSSPTSSS